MVCGKNCLVLAVIGLGSLLLLMSKLLLVVASVMEGLGTEESTANNSHGGKIGSLLLVLQSLDAGVVSSVELGLTADLSRGVVTLSLARGDDNNGQEDLTLLLAIDGVKVEASTDGVTLGGEDLVEGNGGEGNGLISGGLLVEDLDVELGLSLGVKALDGEGLVPGDLLAGIVDGLGLDELSLEVQANAGIGIVLAEALDILQTGSLVNGDLERLGHGWL